VLVVILQTMKISFLLVVAGVLPLRLAGQQGRVSSPLRGQWSLYAEELYTTHDDFFHEMRISRMWTISHHVSLGPSVGVAGAPEHTDNGWDLTRLRFLPVALVADWCPLRGRRGNLLLEGGAGPSFNSYRKREDPIAAAFPVRETGLYARLAAACSVRLQDQIRLCFSVGMKGYHISGNVWDVNPHGVFAGIGCSWTPMEPHRQKKPRHR
jgi:hypothetical protein